MGILDLFKRKPKENLPPENYKLPNFGDLNMNALNDYYRISANFKGNEISFDLNFDHPKATIGKMEKVKYVLQNIDRFDERNKLYIADDFNHKNGDTVKQYIDHHLSDCTEEELSTLIDLSKNSSSHPKQLLKKIKLKRVGIYPDDEAYFAKFDYTIGRRITQYVIVITTNPNGELIYLTTES